MGDIYGITNAVMEQNSLHGRIALANELAQSDYQTKLTNFNNKLRDIHKDDSTTTRDDVVEDLPDLNDAYMSAKGLGAAVVGAYKGGTAGATAFRTSPAMIARKQTLASRSVVAQNQAREAAETAEQAARDPAGAFLGETERVMGGAEEGGEALLSSAGRAVSGAGRAVSSTAVETGELVSDGVRYSGAVVGGALSGAKQGLSEFGGEAGQLGGVEGIVKNVTTVLGGGGEAAAQFGAVAAKGVGAAGGVLAGVGQITSLLNTGDLTERLDTQTGKYVKESKLSEASGFLNEAGAVADVVAGATGGLAVPFAAALNLAGAITGAIGEYKDEKSDDASVGINPDGTSKTPAPTAPKLLNTEAFTSLGFVGNMSHNPLEHIA
jgi:hypothetical protein